LTQGLNIKSTNCTYLKDLLFMRNPVGATLGDYGMWTAHSTAIVDAGASIGPDTRIWHWTHVCADAMVGKNCVLGQGVFIGNGVKIGNGVRIQNNVSIFDGVTLEDNVFCGPGVVFTNVINPRAEISRKSEFRNTLVRRGATLGANSTIICGIVIDEYAFVGAGAVVTSNVSAYALMLGVPATRAGWMSRKGGRLGQDMTCPIDGHHYRFSDNGELEPCEGPD
jgi:UDP-2-acetamido-3-amino-2,3-dideoxy-glucuronate N-acetyltransferase